jgi:hypothetical protein
MEVFTTKSLRFCNILGIVVVILIAIIIYLIRSYAPIFILFYLFAALSFIIIISLIFVNRLINLSEEVTDSSELEIYDEEGLEGRIETVLNQANLVFNRLENDISSLKSRASTVLAILIATVAFLISLLQILHSINNDLTNLQLILFIIPLLILNLISGILLYNVILATKYYEEIQLFEEERYKELLNSTKQEILLDFLYFTRKHYRYNREKYSREAFIYNYSIIFFSSGIIYILVGMFIMFIY